MNSDPVYPEGGTALNQPWFAAVAVGFLCLLDKLDEIVLRRQQEDDSASFECGSGNGFANRHAPPLPATCDFPVQVNQLRNTNDTPHHGCYR